MDYAGIPTNDVGRRIASRLLDLRSQLSVEGPPAKSLENLLLATWNIREFDSEAYGAREDEAYYYIAEIISRFDLVAVQEVRENLEALERVKRILGSWWRFVCTDVTEGTPGNRERMAFLFDARKVRFAGIAGEVVIPPLEEKGPNGKKVYLPSRQLYRTPFLAGFQSAWARFMLCTVHILYGGEADPEDPERILEIDLIARSLAARANDKKAWTSNLLLLGDFNIFSPKDRTMKAMTDAGFVVPAPLQSLPATNTGKEKRHYDQIALFPNPGQLEPTGRAGVFNYYKSVFKDEDEPVYVPSMDPAYSTTTTGKPRDPKSRQTYYRTFWRTHQMSDHLPMWVELQVDHSETYLKGRAT